MSQDTKKLDLEDWKTVVWQQLASKFQTHLTLFDSYLSLSSRFKYLGTRNLICRDLVLLNVPANSPNASFKGNGTSVVLLRIVCHARLSNLSCPPTDWPQPNHILTLADALSLLPPAHLHAVGVCLCSSGTNQQPAYRPAGNHPEASPNVIFKAIPCINAAVFLTSLHQSKRTLGMWGVLGFKMECILASVYSLFTVQPQQNPDFTDYWLI